MEKAITGLKVGLVLVMAAIVSMALVALWSILGWVDVCIVVLVVLGAGIAMWGLLRRKGGKV